MLPVGHYIGCSAATDPRWVVAHCGAKGLSLMMKMKVNMMKDDASQYDHISTNLGIINSIGKFLECSLKVQDMCKLCLGDHKGLWRFCEVWELWKPLVGWIGAINLLNSLVDHLKPCPCLLHVWKTKSIWNKNQIDPKPKSHICSCQSPCTMEHMEHLVSCQEFCHG